MPFWDGTTALAVPSWDGTTEALAAVLSFGCFLSLQLFGSSTIEVNDDLKFALNQ